MSPCGLSDITELHCISQQTYIDNRLHKWAVLLQHFRELYVLTCTNVAQRPYSVCPMTSELYLLSKWVSRVSSRSVKSVMDHTAAVLFDAATQNRSITDTTMRVGVDRRAKPPQR